MRRKQRDRLRQQPPLTFEIARLTHEGRGVSHYQAGHLDEGLIVPQGQDSPVGKTVFVSLCLPGEIVRAEVKETSRRLDEADTVEVIQASAERVAPPCPHFGVCGGCSLQHWSPDGQIAFKQQVLAELFTHAGVTPKQWLPPIRSRQTDYRRRARLGVRFVEKRGETLIGFRERRSNFLADLHVCKVLDARIGERLDELRQLLNQLSIRSQIAQLEVAAGDTDIAIMVRHLQPMSPADEQLLLDFCRPLGWQLYLQPGGYDTVRRIDQPEAPHRLTYALPDFGLILAFSPLDFTQVNAGVNQQMVALACDLLQLQTGQRVLDLFCGLGNFSLPIARRVGGAAGTLGQVVAVEGSADMVARGEENAAANGLHNLAFHAFDLTKPLDQQAWAQGQFDAVLIDPPRSGALELMPFLTGLAAPRIVYVSCNPITLARDAAQLVAGGYRLTQAGVMDMFTHTSHVESIACFEYCGI